MGIGVEHDFPGGNCSGSSGRRPAQEGVHLCKQHPGAEGLCHIVVRTAAVAPELVLLPAPGGEEDDGHPAHLPGYFAHGKPVQTGHHHVQDHQVHGVGFQEHQGVFAVAGGKAGVPAPAHVVRDDVLHDGFIFSDQYLCHVVSALLGMGFLHDSTKTPAAQGAPQKGGACEKRASHFPPSVL